MANWMPIAGEFDQKGQSLVFRGKTIAWEYENQALDVAALGHAIYSERFGGGTLSASVEFSVIDGDSVCELVLYYDPNTRFFVSAGLGAGGAMFGVRHWDGSKWTTHRAAGDRANLKAKHKYRVAVTVRGSRVKLSVDDVDVLTVDLPYSLPQSQVGVWCASRDAIIISDYKLQTQRPKAFVVMQFTSPYNELYNDVIRPVCQELGLDVIRADEEYGPGVIVADVARQIVESKVIIAEITPANPNVYYEVGYARALNKPTILIAEKPTQLPFDVSPFRTLFYENSINGKAKIEDGLRKHLQAITSEPGLG